MSALPGPSCKNDPCQRCRAELMNFAARRLLIIWLLQQATIGSVAACHDRRSREHFASFSLTLLGRKPASNIWALAGGQMGSLVRDAGTEKLMSW
jgi:hypothetical protein